MSTIILHKINKNNNTLSFEYSYSDELARFFTEKKFVIEYPENIELVPDSVCAVPFVCSILPIIWLTDSELVVKEIDKNFYECIPEVKKGYVNMFPEARFLGKISVENIVETQTGELKNSALFYSGGVDSTYTLLKHLDEKPILLSIWGSDIKFDNVDGWKKLHSTLHEGARFYDLEMNVFKSSFREFDNEWELTKTFSEKLKDNWWHGVKHGIALLGHVAPFAFLHGITKMYIAATHSLEDEKVRCASNPAMDNHVKFSNCQVYHDGFEANRQKKINYITNYGNTNHKHLPLHVCWETQTGENCCHCEKCYRTIIGIIAENSNPCEYGFKSYNTHLEACQKIVTSSIEDDNLKKYWNKIKNTFITNLSLLKNRDDYEYIKWIKSTNFDKLAKQNASQSKPNIFYRGLRKIKHILKKCYTKLKNSFYRNAYIIGTPTHTNIGDSAIAIAEKEFLKTIYKHTSIIEITFTEYLEHRDNLKNTILTTDAIYLHGGGNMGNQWFNEEEFRRTVLSDFPNNKIVIFPQTIHYLKNEHGITEEKNSIFFYDNKPNLTLVAREQKSYETMQALYPNTKILLVPDIVLSTTKKTFGILQDKHKRDGILCVFRTDDEKSLTRDTITQLKAELENLKLQYSITDMHATMNITKENRSQVVHDKLLEFASAKLVITDRLHGMIFAAITGTPCIVFSNYNHKVKGSYDWISYLPYIKYVETLDEALHWLPILLKQTGCYDNSRLKQYFSQLKTACKI